MNTLFCPWEQAQYFIISSNIPKLFFYSHIPAMVIALIFGVIVFRRAKNFGVGPWLLVISSLFFIWGFFDLILWATNDPSVVVFFWTLQIYIEPLIFAGALLMSYGFLMKKPFPFKSQIILFLSIVPLVLFLSTRHAVSGVTLDDCNAIEGFFAHYYTYILETAYILGIIFIAFEAFYKAIDRSRRSEIKFFTLGMILFLLSFSSLNIVGSFTDDWIMAQIGLIGMPIFVAFLAYIIVRFKTFNLKVFGTQILVLGLLFLVSSLVFVRTISNIQIIVSFTLIFILIAGYQLVKSVKREIDQRSRLEILRLKLEESNIKLETANDKLKDLDKLKTEFLSLASHQLRSPLTAIRGYISMILEGDYGEVNEKAKEAIQRVMQSSQNLTKVVEDLLNVSKIEQGGMKYEMAPFDLTTVVSDMEKDLSITAQQKGLKMFFDSDNNSAPYIVNGDKEKIRQVILNLIDNSIKYTKEGSINVSLKKDEDKVLFAVKDTGMGMTPEIKATLFQKFARGDGARMNTGGSGLGLYLAREIVEAHNGVVGVESEGPGKGSIFFMKLNLAK